MLEGIPEGGGGLGGIGGLSLVDKHGGRVWPRGLQVLHGVPLIYTALLRRDAALIVAHPGERHAAGEVVVPSRYFACLVEDLQR